MVGRCLARRCSAGPGLAWRVFGKEQSGVDGRPAALWQAWASPGKLRRGGSRLGVVWRGAVSNREVAGGAVARSGVSQQCAFGRGTVCQGVELSRFERAAEALSGLVGRGLDGFGVSGIGRSRQWQGAVVWRKSNGGTKAGPNWDCPGGARQCGACRGLARSRVGSEGLTRHEGAARRDRAGQVTARPGASRQGALNRRKATVGTNVRRDAAAAGKGSSGRGSGGAWPGMGA